MKLASVASTVCRERRTMVVDVSKPANEIILRRISSGGNIITQLRSICYLPLLFGIHGESSYPFTQTTSPRSSRSLPRAALPRDDTKNPSSEFSFQPNPFAAILFLILISSLEQHPPEHVSGRKRRSNEELISITRTAPEVILTFFRDQLSARLATPSTAEVLAAEL